MGRRVDNEMNVTTSLLWFRRDLRLADNPALSAAIAARRPVAAVYILDAGRAFAPGGAQRWFLHHALASLRDGLDRLGIPLLLRIGPEAGTLLSVAKEVGAAAAFWNRRYSAEDVATDREVKEALKRDGVEAQSFNGSLLREPWEVETKSGGPYRVYTPFWNTVRALGPGRREIKKPAAAALAHSSKLKSDDLDALRLLPAAPDWAAEFGEARTASESGAAKALDRFLSHAASTYGEDRNRPDLRGTSRLSPHLALGTISPLRVWNAAQTAIASGAVREVEGMKFLSELVWREFAYHLLYFNPSIPTAPLRGEFKEFPWRDDERSFHAWTRGQTGIPIVDAGMRELWRTGWMHNRVRMIVASFLTKNLLIPWQKGERWFWDTLIDADPASNAASWQWVAGSGRDAAPYFRIFNPVTQGEKFDPEGRYVRKFVPEISSLPADLIHAPWKSPEFASSSAYPRPIVDLDQSRKRALAAYQDMKSSAARLETAGQDA